MTKAFVRRSAALLCEMKEMKGRGGEGRGGGGDTSPSYPGLNQCILYDQPRYKLDMLKRLCCVSCDVCMVFGPF